MASRKRSISNDADVPALYKEWDEASCPICLDHPHNAVVLICSSHDKGCRSYICDTSYRHSNCLDRFKKLKEQSSDSLPLSSENVSEGSGAHSVNAANVDFQEQEDSKLRCPLCRSTVLGWKVLEDAREYLNSKSRSCSRESCSFSGNYRELRRHARRVHPTVRPADVDPTRQRAWHRLENQREYNDIVSAIRSAVPGAVVVGDYMIESGDRLLGERNRTSGGSVGESGRWLSTLFLFQMIGSLDRPGAGSRPRVLPRHRRASGSFSRRRYLWGENLLGLQENDDDDDNDDHDDEDDEDVHDDDEQDLNVPSDLGPPNRRRRRRLTRAESDEDQQ